MIFKDKTALAQCHIYQMLRQQSKKPHTSFHTPGHKRRGWDITELSYSDNLSAPHGCIAQAEKDIAKRLGAKRSFILTDGSTAGVLSMLYAAKRLGVKNILADSLSHKSFFNGCALMGITPLLLPKRTRGKIPFPYTMSEMNELFPESLALADALFLTSPDYYGNVMDLQAIRRFCDEQGKLLLIDGAHGGHLHFDKNVYAGAYAHLWVDGVHKNLPAFTQGAVVSAQNEQCAEALKKGVDIFRSTSPSYPIMASVEYAVKYPRNLRLEEKVKAFARSSDRIYTGSDWSKLCAIFGEKAQEIKQNLESEGIYPEFCDGNVIMFYLSPATTDKEFEKLKKRLLSLFEQTPFTPNAEIESQPLEIPAVSRETEWIELSLAEGRVCAENCGLFPPCTPLILRGERVTEEKIRLLLAADNVFGVAEGKILVWKEKGEE